ncbi:MAG: DUF6544 family protein [Actinomycetes bacterium]
MTGNGRDSAGAAPSRSLRARYDSVVAAEFADQPMRARPVQYNFFARPSRLFLMEARTFGLPIRALHVYREESATFTVRVASAMTMVDLRGPDISAAETVTVLNDLCLMAPGALLDPRLVWTEADQRTACVTFTNGPHRVTATLTFDDDGDLVEFWSDDRPDSSSGHFIPMRWSTPISEHRDVGGMHLLHRGSAVYHRPDGPFTYGDFTIRSIEYDIAGPVIEGRRP